VEIPMLSEGGSLDGYRATLTRLEPLVEQASWVVPGHGTPLDREHARQILAEDVAYIEQLGNDPSGASLPKTRASAVQRRIHAANLKLGAT
jgi:glyoxylase-like metal-dependent hydrolase (beta-lactamase superfamily II)